MVMTGCTGEPAPIVTETPVPTLSPGATVAPSPSPGEGGPLRDEELLAILPPGAERDDVQGAVVTAHFFVELFPEVARTAEFEVWDALSLPGCDFCANVRSRALSDVELGIAVRGGDVELVEGTTETVPQDDEALLVAVVVSEADLFVTEPGQAERLAVAGADVRFLVLVRYDGSAWRVVDVEANRI
ncbi:MAG: hypothetical protein CVT64_04105 [Actinobacteria bacterium HGW-Actinobacteria-4]|nr:MAG: hypothetical protein CVT64_04105 [Actinobacteria bacterium HGW-Actinobacteria-4]